MFVKFLLSLLALPFTLAWWLLTNAVLKPAGVLVLAAGHFALGVAILAAVWLLMRHLGFGKDDFLTVLVPPVVCSVVLASLWGALHRDFMAWWHERIARITLRGTPARGQGQVSSDVAAVAAALVFCATVIAIVVWQWPAITAFVHDAIITFNAKGNQP